MDISPKAAQRQRQKSAKDRKRIRAEKIRAKKTPRLVAALIDEFDRWMRREPPEPFTARCLGCGKDVFVTYEGGRMQHGHVDPVCEAYRTLEKIAGTESATLEAWKNPEADSPLPAWAEGPHAELTREEGEGLVDAGEVRTSSVVTHALPDGMIQMSMIARTGEGLFWWPLDDPFTPPALETPQQVCDRLGIDVDTWAAEIRAKVDAAQDAPVGEAERKPRGA